MAQFKCDHVHLRSPDPEAAAHYYTDMFGATVTSRMQNGNAPAGRRRPGRADAVHSSRWRLATPVPPPPPFMGVEHIGLAVTGFDAAVAELRAKGAVFAVEPQSPRAPASNWPSSRPPTMCGWMILERS